MRTYAHTYIYTLTCMHIHTRLRIHRHACAQTHTRTHTQRLTFPPTCLCLRCRCRRISRHARPNLHVHNRYQRRHCTCPRYVAVDRLPLKMPPFTLRTNGALRKNTPKKVTIRKLPEIASRKRVCNLAATRRDARAMHVRPGRTTCCCPRGFHVHAPLVPWFPDCILPVVCLHASNLIACWTYLPSRTTLCTPTLTHAAPGHSA